MSIKVRIKSMFIRFSSYNGNIVSTNPTSKECSYCKKSFTKQSWCKECDPLKVIEGWTSGNPNVDKFIKDTMYRARHERHPKFLEWVRFDRLGNFKVIGKGGFSKVYSAIWKDGRSEFKQTIDGRWIKRKPKPMEVVLKRLIESENISTQYLHELQIYYGLTTKVQSLELYGMTKHPRTNEYILIFEFANLKSLRRILFNDFRKLLWKEKMIYLFEIIHELDKLHKLGCCHRDLHSGNVLRSQPAKGNAIIYLSDFGLSGTANKESLSENIYGILPYTAPEVLSGKPYTLASDIYSFGVLMIELSSGKPPFYNRKHDLSLILDVYNGVRPEFGKGTPDFYKELACKCMDIDPGKRPTANELCAVLRFWRYTFVLESYRKDTKFGYCGRDIKEAFDKANEEIPNISTSYRRNPDAKYASRLLSLTSSLNHDTSNLI